MNLPWTPTAPRIKSKTLARPLLPWPNLLPFYPSIMKLYTDCTSASLVEFLPTSWPLHMHFPLPGMPFPRSSEASLICFLGALFQGPRVTVLDRTAKEAPIPISGFLACLFTCFPLSPREDKDHISFIRGGAPKAYES